MTQYLQSQDVMTFPLSQFIRDANDGLFAEASSLQLAPGHFPTTVIVEGAHKLTFHVWRRDCYSAHYRTTDCTAELTILND